MSRDMTYLRGKSAIVGIAQCVSPTGVLEKSERDLEVDMVMDALDDAGLSLADVDGLFCTGMMLPTIRAAKYFLLQAAGLLAFLSVPASAITLRI